MTAPKRTDAPEAQADGPPSYPEPSALNLHQRKARVILDTGRIFKAGKATQGGGYKYVRHDDVMEEVRESMARHGLLLSIRPDMEHSIRAEFAKTSNGVMQYRWLIWVSFRLTNADEPTETETVTYPGEGIDTGDKAIGKALSYATKNYLLKTFLLPSGDEADNEHGPQPEPQRQAQRQPQRQAQGQADPDAARKKALRAFWAAARKAEISEDAIHAWFSRNLKLESTKEANPDQLAGATAWATGYREAQAKVQDIVRDAGIDVGAMAAFIGQELHVENPEAMTLAEWAECEHHAKKLAAGEEPPGRGPDTSMAALAAAALDKLQATREEDPYDE